MSEDTLRREAESRGIASHYRDAFGEDRVVPAGTLEALLERLGPAGPAAASLLIQDEGQALAIPCPGMRGTIRWRLRGEDGSAETGEASLPDGQEVLSIQPVAGPGYHHLEIECGDDLRKLSIATAPAAAPQPLRKLGHTAWGVAAQFYGLRGSRDWGIGDFTVLGDATRALGAAGADFLGISPIHALFPAEPRHVSPYSPSSRRFLNPMFIDVARAPGFEQDEELRGELTGRARTAQIDALRRSAFVEYPEVAAAKMEALARLHERFQARPGNDPEVREYQAFLEREGEGLRRHALFQALHEHMLQGNAPLWSWREWPEELRAVERAERSDLARRVAPRGQFFEWLEWLCRRQLQHAQSTALEGGMGLGIYLDLAVGTHPDGSACWADPEAFLDGVSFGAPPDLLARGGQDWGLIPYSPTGLAHTGYRAFIDLLRGAMADAGAVRIDHVMSLQRLFCIPAGRPAAEGTYIAYPRDDLLRLVALEAQRNDCVVIGEDLGTVPEGFREAMMDRGLQSYRVVYFEEDERGELLEPSTYPEQALATITTHDLPTLQGFTAGRDIEWRREIGAMSEEAEQSERDWRRSRVRQLEAAAGVASSESARFRDALYAHVAAAPSAMLAVAAEDLEGEIEQPNLPGTVDEHPNWRRRLPASLPDALADPANAELLRNLNTIRRKPRS